MPIVFIPASLRKLTGGVERTAVNGRTVRQVIEELDRRFPGFRAQLIDGGDLKASVAVSIDGEIGTGGLLEPLRENSEIHFLPALSGGC